MEGDHHGVKAVLAERGVLRRTRFVLCPLWLRAERARAWRVRTAGETGFPVSRLGISAAASVFPVSRNEVRAHVQASLSGCVAVSRAP